MPNVFDMNFQVVSVGQKLIEKNVAAGGYLDAIGTPTPELVGEIQFVDAALLPPFSESPLNPTRIGPTEDDISLLWLADPSKTGNAVTTLEDNASKAAIGEIFVGPTLDQMFNAHGLAFVADND